MGNLVSCCHVSDDNNERCCCVRRMRGRLKGGMVPADLHSSGAQGDQNAQKKSQGNVRPRTLQTKDQSMPSTSRTQKSKPKSSEFSLHGIQKMSPVEYSDENLNMKGQSVHEEFRSENLSALFDNYKDTDCDEILAEGIASLCNDLEVDPAEFIVLALAWKFKASTMCKFTREEFMNGCISLEVDSIDSLKESFSRLEQESLDNFKDIYKFAFQFGLDSDQGQRSLPSDVAVGMWRVVFSRNPPILLENWIRFLEDCQIRGISRDTWNMFLHFTENVGSDLSNYDDNEAWPSLFDDFVEYYRAKKVSALQVEEKDSNKDQNENVHLQSVVQQEEFYEIELDDQVVSNVLEANTSGTPDRVSHEESTGSIPALDSAEDSMSGSVTTIPNQPDSELDSEPIRCNTLHSSHMT